jgi:hypothetical protein
MIERPEDLLIRRQSVIDLGAPDRSLRREVLAGRLVRVVPGAFISAGVWTDLLPIERHRLTVLATARRLRTEVVFSHHAAAALWGIRMLRGWPKTVDVTLERASGGRSDGLLRRHCRGFDAVEVTRLGGLLVTTPSQTVADLALKLPFADAVVAMDSALHRKRKPAPLATREKVLDRVTVSRGVRGWRRAMVAAEFSTALSDSPEESHSRVQIHLLGFPAPVLQRRFHDARGFVAETDFYWEEFDHAGESDGRSKYTDPALRGGRTAEEVVIAERHRENRLRRLVRTLSRWEPADLYPAAKLYRILTEAGLPSTGARLSR